MKKTILLLLLIIVTSCKQKENPYTMYGLFNNEYNYSIEMLKVEIKVNLSKDKLNSNELARVYDSLTVDYLTYLDKTYTELLSNLKLGKDKNYDEEFSKKEHVNDLFFTEEPYNEKGTEFIAKLEKYRVEVLKLIKDENLANRINATLNTMDIRNREGKRIKYLNYIYQDTPLISVLAHMKSKENSILELENNFLKNIQLNK